MLRELIEKKHVKIIEEAKDWKEAIRISCEVLEADGTVEANYKEDIIKCIEKYGPYIVIAPNIAMPHSQENAEGVNKTAISFLKINKPVSFEDGNPELDAQLFFTLASCNSEEHLSNMMKLSELLGDNEMVENLAKAKSINDLLTIQEKYIDS